MKKLIFIIIFLLTIASVSASSFLTKVELDISGISGISQLDNSDGTSLTVTITDSIGGLVVSRYAEEGIYNAGDTIPMVGEKFSLNYGTDYNYNLSTYFGDFLYSFTTPSEPAGGDSNEYQGCYGDFECSKTNSCQQRNNESWDNPDWIIGREDQSCGSSYVCKSGECKGLNGANCTEHIDCINDCVGGVCKQLCSDGFITVPGNVTFGTTDFCVMKYEAKNVSGVATSQADLTPWVSITQTAAIAECSNIGAHLCTVNEVQTINRNIEAQAANWANNVIGSTVVSGGGLKRGNVGIVDSVSYNGIDYEYGTGRDAKAELIFSNSETIWDWSGNVNEWIYGEGDGGTIGTGWYGTGVWIDWNNAQVDNLERDKLGPSNSSWTANNGIGRYDGGVGTHAFLHGGGYNNDANAGVFSLLLYYAPSTSFRSIGFRCCK